MRILGIDYGEVWLGLAISDPSGSIASPLTTLAMSEWQKNPATLDTILAENEIAEIVIGLPIQMNGSEGEMAKKTTHFADTLAARYAEIAVYTWDERLTSAEAERVLLEANMRRRRRKQIRNQIAAALILQAFLDHRATESPC